VHEIKLNDLKDARQLTQAVLQITQMLGMYQAELARILGLQCSDIGALASASQVLTEGSLEWGKARQFVALYERLYRFFAGDAVAIFHWLRASHTALDDTPLILLVDEDRLDEVLAWFDSAAARELLHGSKIQT
jgi:hypothetical protein